MFGGVTLVAAYSLGAVSLRTDVAPPLLVGIGLLQMAIGALWLIRPRLLRGALLRRPGSLVAVALGAAIAVNALGGSGVDRVYITSVQCWLIAAGCALPGYRLAVALALAAAISLTAWAAVDAGAAGYNVDGALLTATIGLVSSFGAGLWMGRVTGLVIATLNRWHLVEIHELGIVRELRELVAQTDAAARTLADTLGALPHRPELTDLAHRLRHGLGVDLDQGAPSTRLDELIARIATTQLTADGALQLHVDLNPSDSSAVLTPVVAAAVETVVQRQLGNVARHAPSATAITIRADVHGDHLRVSIEDDGGGGLAFRAGTGTLWSQRQLARVGGSARYFAGEAGVGFELHVQLSAGAIASDIDGLSVDSALTRFGTGILGAIRLAGYVGDSLSAHAEADAIGAWWLAMPLGAVAIELTLRGGLRHASPWTPQRLVLAAILSAALAAAFALPTGGLDAVVPATTSVIIPAHLLYQGLRPAFVGVELLRLAAVSPLLFADLAGSAGLLLIYPAGMYLIVRALTRFMGRARDLEQRAADASGRATLATAAVRGLTLQHDALDVLSRLSDPPAPVLRAARDLEKALTALSRAAVASLDPRSVVETGLSAALGGPLGGPATTDRGSEARGEVPAGAIDRITLVELAALVADERASCAPPGVLGRRRLDRVHVDWFHSAVGPRTRISVVAQPTLRGPDRDCVARVEAVAATLGIEVQAGEDAILLLTNRA